MRKQIDRHINVDQISLDVFAPTGRGQNSKYGDGVLFADVQEIRLPDGFADGKIILHVLEHVPKLMQAFDNLKAVLKPHPDSFVYIEVPCHPVQGTAED